MAYQAAAKTITEGMIYCAFYTRDTIYEQEAARLRLSLDKLSLRHDIRGVESRGSWAANTAMTAGFICDMLAAYDGPIVYLDADAVVWSTPALFDVLSPEDHDIAVHYRNGIELLNGTLWLANTPGCKAVIADYRARIVEGERNEQRQLDFAIKAAGIEERVYRLPAGYCFIHDVMACDLDSNEPVVIEHLQASRVSSNSTLLPNRIRRLKEIGG